MDAPPGGTDTGPRSRKSPQTNGFRKAPLLTAGAAFGCPSPGSAHPPLLSVSWRVLGHRSRPSGATAGCPVALGDLWQASDLNGCCSRRFLRSSRSNWTTTCCSASLSDSTLMIRSHGQISETATGGREKCCELSSGLTSGRWHHPAGLGLAQINRHGHQNLL